MTFVDWSIMVGVDLSIVASVSGALEGRKPLTSGSWPVVGCPGGWSGSRPLRPPSMRVITWWLPEEIRFRLDQSKGLVAGTDPGLAGGGLLCDTDAFSDILGLLVGGPNDGTVQLGWLRDHEMAAKLPSGVAGPVSLNGS